MLTTLTDLILYPHIMGFNYGTRSKSGINDRRDCNSRLNNWDSEIIRKRSIILSMRQDEIK